MRDVSNKTLAFLLVMTIVVSLAGTFITLSVVNSRFVAQGGVPLTGMAVVPNATATLTVQGSSSISFTQATINFGSGSVDTEGGFTNCTLSSKAAPYGTNSGCVSFSAVSTPLTVENDGNTNLTVELRTNVTAMQFIGIDSAKFLWNVSVAEAGSCVNTTAVTPNVQYPVVEPNTSAQCQGAGTDGGTDCGTEFENVSNTDKVICPRLLSEDSRDSLNIDINVSIPLDAPLGVKLAGFIVTGTRDPSS